MTIEYGAFLNCQALKKIHFIGIDLPVFTNISRNNLLPKDFLIVVPDNILQQQLECELPNNKQHVVSESDYKLLKLKKKCNFNIYAVLWHLSKISCSKLSLYFTKYLIDKHNIDLALMEKIFKLLESEYKIQKIV